MSSAGMINERKSLDLTTQSYENYFHTFFYVIKVSNIRLELGNRNLFVIKQQFVMIYCILKVAR